MQKETKKTCAAAPREADLAPLCASPAFRADMLFFIRLCGTYCQNIFWQVFAPSARQRRRQLFTLIREGAPAPNGKIKPFGKEFKKAILNPKTRRAQTTDILHQGFITVLSALKNEKSPQGHVKFYEVFSQGLKQRHGLPWNIDDFIEAARLIIKMRNFLEHYAEFTKNDEKDKIPSAEEGAQFLFCLGLLLLPQFCNELEHSAKRLKTTQAGKAAAQMAAIFACAKEKRSAAIGAMFAEARARKNIYPQGQERTKSGKYKNKKQKSRELLNGKRRKYYYGLKLSPTDLKLNSFKRAYDFIGEQNFRQICQKLGAPLNPAKLRQFDEDNPQKKEFNIYASEENRLRFKDEILPFYILIIRIQKQIHLYLTAYAEKNPQLSPARKSNLNKRQLKNAEKDKGKIKDENLRAIRNQIAHSGLFWQAAKSNGADKKAEGVFSEEEVFVRIMAILTPQNPLIADSPAPRPATFCNALKAILEKENCPIVHTEKTAAEPPKTVKLRKTRSAKRLEQQKTAHKQGKKELRTALRFRIRKLINALENAQKSLRPAQKIALISGQDE